jgi:hypothetical protein
LKNYKGDEVTTEGNEAIRRAETIQWVFHVGLISSEQYRKILQNREVFHCVYPTVNFENPKITHTIEGSDYIFQTTKREIINEQNFNLLKGHLISLSIVGLTEVLEHYLKEILQNHFNQNVDKGIFNTFKDTFKDKTGRKITDFDKYTRLYHHYQLRHIIVHKLSRIDEKFKKKTGEMYHKEDPYVFYPSQVSEYQELIKDFVNFVDSYLE